VTTVEPTQFDAIQRRLRGGIEIVAGTLRRNPLTLLGALIVCFLAALAVVGPVVTPYDPAAQNLANRLRPPSLAHPLGTDRFGRDLLTRIVYGARFSLGIGVAVTAIRVVVGTAIGLISGYAGGWVDEALMRLVDIQLAFPGLVLALVVAGVLGPSLRNLLIALAVVGWSTYARVVRGSVLSIKERRYVDAARLIGTPRRRLFRRHLLPNVISPVVVIATLNLGTVVLATAGLSFIGLGAQPPTPEWGTMLAGGDNTCGRRGGSSTQPGGDHAHRPRLQSARRLGCGICLTHANRHGSRRSEMSSLLTIENLQVEFDTADRTVTAVDGASLSVNRGEILGLVGESGSGKSVTARSIMGLELPGRITGGTIHYDGTELTGLSDSARQQYRGSELAMVFQDPSTTLNPVFDVGEQIAESLRLRPSGGRSIAA